MNEITENPSENPVPSDFSIRKKPPVALWVSVFGLLVAIVALIMVLTGGLRKSTVIPMNNNGNISIAWVNSDTLWEKYAFVADVKAELEVYEKNLQNQYTASVTAFQNEYNEYVKKASAYQLTLEEQKKTEEKLAQKQQALQELDAKLSQLLIDEKTTRNMEVHDSIVNFIARFNKNYHFTFIMEQSYSSSILYADSTLEITAPVIKGLNEEYMVIKKRKEEESKK